MFEEDIQNLKVDSLRILPKARRKISAEPADSKKQTDRIVGATATTQTKYDGLGGLLTPHAKTIYPEKSSEKPFFFKKKFWLWAAALALVGLLIFGGYKIGDLGSKIFAGKSPLSFLASFGQFFGASDRKLQGEEQGVANILLLGIGGEGHDGSLLTDTIILASIKPEAESESGVKISLLSIPRDLVVKLPGGLDWRKINSAYAYGEFKQKGLGVQWITQAVQDLSGEKIPYYAVIDFAGFKQAIDDLGGIDVYVDNAFSDSAYPDYRDGYLPTIKFQAGQQHMDGERALQFARSRHGSNNEGSDFARSRRQQKILAAVKDKTGKLKITSLGTINKLLDNFSNHFTTNLEPWAIKRVYDLTRSIPDKNIIPVSLDPTSGIVCNQIAKETGAYILATCPGKTSLDIRQFIANRFIVGEIFKEAAKIEIQNSTKIAGLAQRAEIILKKYTMQTSVVNLPDKQAYSLTTLYDLSGGEKPATLEYLKSTLDLYVAATDYPFADKLSQPKPDFVLVLGTDANSKIEQLFLEINRAKQIVEPFASD